MKKSIKNIIAIIFLVYMQNTSFAQQSYGGWSVSDYLHDSRAEHASVVLPDSNILVIGGHGRINYQGIELSSCEIYDIKTGKWRYTDSMSVDRCYHKGILLDNGKVLVIGGFNRRTCELFDPATEKWTVIDSTVDKRYWQFTATKLKSGKVLVTGGHYFGNGYKGSVTQKTCELFDLETNKWTLTDSLKVERQSHTATLLKNGKILVVGGTDLYGHELKSCEIYDPETNKWSYTDSLKEERRDHLAVLLPDGKVLVTGGKNSREWGDYIGKWVTSVEIFDPETNKWSPGRDRILAIAGQQGFLLSNGNVMFLGGTPGRYWEIYNPIEFKTVKLDTLPLSIDFPTFNFIGKDKILSAGGYKWEDISVFVTNECEIYDASLTAVEGKSSSPIHNFSLSQNYPNPFNPTTTISYTIPKASYVELKVYNMLGREVRTLISREQAAGSYNARFEAPLLPSGMYIYEIRAGNFTKSGKMLLLK